MRHQVLLRYVMNFIKMAVKVEYRLSKIQYLAEVQYTWNLDVIYIALHNLIPSTKIK